MSPRELKDAVSGIARQQFDVALISQGLAEQIGPEDELWDKLGENDIASVLVSEDRPLDFADIRLRASFASIIPATPNFEELRSALRIGRSFAKQLRISQPKEQEAIQAPQLVSTTPRSVLVADDNRTNRNVLAAILGSAGHRVSMATDGDEALDMLEKGGIDILLLDVNMPRLNGIDACRMWRQIEGNRQHLPIVGVTADATPETEQLCLNAGMDLRLTKPVNAKLLLSTIEALCPIGGDVTQHAADPLNVVVPISGLGASPSIDGGQIAYLWSIGDRNFIAGMIDGFFEDVGQVIGPMKTAVATGDVQQFRFCAHAFKSAANNMGAIKLAAMCAKFEKITEGDFNDRGSAYLDKIEQELKAVEAELRSPQILVRPASSAA